MVSGMLISLGKGKATEMGTSLAAVPSAAGPTGTGPSNGPAQTPAQAAAAASKKVPLSAEERRKALKKLAEQLKNNPDRVEVLGKLADKAAELVEGVENPASAMLDDLKHVVVGEGLMNGDVGRLSVLSEDLRLRGTGTHYAGPFPGLGGFHPSFNDGNNRGDQMSHAMAGIYIGHNYGALAEQTVMALEPESADDRLYRTTFAIGDALNDDNYANLGNQIRNNLGPPTAQGSSNASSSAASSSSTSAGSSSSSGSASGSASSSSSSSPSAKSRKK